MVGKREFKPRTRSSRPSGVRDAKLIVIASEGACTERVYFDDMASIRYYYNSRIHVEILERIANSASSPEYVIQQLDYFRREYDLRQRDELWLVIDVDRWSSKKLADIATQCRQKGYYIAVSYPCFEIWLLLHLKSLNEYSPQILDEFRTNAKIGYRTRLEVELVSILGEYNKTNPNTDHFLPYVARAIKNAREIDINPGNRWPNDLGTRVYLLAEKIMG